MVMGDVTTRTELLVIGAGPGGYVCAISAAQRGVDTTLVEKEAYGGTCLNVGCIPSKALISATDVAHAARDAEHLGVHADPAVDLATMVDWKNGVVDQLTGGVESLCEAAGVTLVEGTAEFAGDQSAQVTYTDEQQGTETIQFDHAVIGTGSRPIEIPEFEFDGERVLSSADALALDAVPDALLVVGGGYIGMELATVYQKLGADVTVVEMLEDVLPGYEDDVATVVRDRAEDIGVDFHFGLTATEWDAVGDEDDSEGIRVRAEDDDGAVSEFEADRCLVAVGRQPVLDMLSLEATGVETDENGFVLTDDQGRTSVRSIFAVGDVAGEPMLAHKAMAEGKVAAEVVAGDAAALDHQAVPAIVYTDPEVATVGMTRADAEAASFNPIVGTMPLGANGRALTLDDADGFVRIVADEETGFVLGAQIVAPEASEMIAEIGVAIEMGATLQDLAASIHGHPTLSEAVHEAVLAARGEAIHTR